MFNKKNVCFLVFSLVFVFVFMGCASNKTISQNDIAELIMKLQFKGKIYHSPFFK